MAFGRKSEIDWLREELERRDVVHAAAMAAKDGVIEELTRRLANLADPIGQSRADQATMLAERALAGATAKKAKTEGDEEVPATRPRPFRRSHSAAGLARDRPDRPSESQPLTQWSRDFVADPAALEDEGQPAESRPA